MANTGFTVNGSDVGSGLVGKDYLIDRYPELADTFRFAGLWLWGSNDYGQLGNNTVTKTSSPVQTIAGGANWKLLNSSIFTVAGIKTDGTLWLWGTNQYGRLGTNNTTNYSSPVQTISGGTNWKQVSNGPYHTYAIKTDGTLWGWGSNTVSSLGLNTYSGSFSSPVQTVAGGTNWKLVSAGQGFTGAIKTNGTLWMWGQVSYGQCGDNQTSQIRASPVQTVAGGTNWKTLSCGGGNTMAIKTDGTLWMWGLSVNGGAQTVSSPVQTISGGTNWKQVSAGNGVSAAIKTDGTLWLWGENYYGQLGTGQGGAGANKSSPVQTIASGTNWKQVSAGWSNTSATGAIKTDGTLWMWGYNTQGQVGDNTIIHKSSPVQTVAGGTNWLSISTNGRYASAIRDNSEDLL